MSADQCENKEGVHMSTQSDYSVEDWKAISAAPVLSGLFLSLSDASGPIGLTKEALAVSRAINESVSGNAPEVVKSLADSVKTAGGRPELPDVPKGDRATMRAALISHIKAAVTAVETKSPAEVEGYKSWLVSVAVKVSQASKEGGFLGIGGTLVSPEEQEALAQLARTLGVSAPASTG
jgi:hypothetical protein